MNPTQPAQTVAPTNQPPAPIAGPDAEVWDTMIDALIAQDPWPEEEEELEPDPFGGIPLRIYEVVEVRPREGIRLEELSCTEDLPRFWIADPRTVEFFAVGDVFGLGWNDEEASIWPPSRWTDSTRL